MGLGLLAKVQHCRAVACRLPQPSCSVRQRAALKTRPPLLGCAAAASWRRWSTASLAVAALALAPASPWLLRNWRLYGDPLGLELTRQTVDVRTTPWSWTDTTWLLSGWFRSFWGKFGGAGHIPMPEWIYWLLAAACLLALAGLVKFWFTRVRPSERAAVALLALSVADGCGHLALFAAGAGHGSGPPALPPPGRSSRYFARLVELDAGARAYRIGRRGRDGLCCAGRLWPSRRDPPCILERWENKKTAPTHK